MSYVKSIQCSQYLMINEYLDLPLKLDITTKKHRNIYVKNKSNDEIRSDSLLRTSRNLKYSILSNINDWKSFFTLTFAVEPLSSKEANKQFTRFIRALRYKFGKNVKYLGLIERGSKNGRLHYHILFSEFLPIGVLRNLWGVGLVFVKKIYNGGFRLGGYLSKYLTKTEVWGFAHYRKIFKSLNLLKPIIKTGLDSIFYYCKDIATTAKMIYNVFNKDLNFRYTVYEL